jgi:hypothetical protein
MGAILTNLDENLATERFNTLQTNRYARLLDSEGRMGDGWVNEAR